MVFLPVSRSHFVHYSWLDSWNEIATVHKWSAKTFAIFDIFVFFRKRRRKSFKTENFQKSEKQNFIMFVICNLAQEEIKA